MGKPIISVCVICYNQEKYIADCLSSIVRQILDYPFEVVVGDDCSTDKTREIIREFEKKYPAVIRLLPSDKNLGIVPNFLRTAKECRGDFVAFCEGDDYWIDDKKLAIQKDVLDKNAIVDLVFHPSIGRVAQLSDGDTLVGYHGIASQLIAIEDVVVGRGGIIPSASIFFRKTVIEFIPEWFSEMPGCDYHLKVLGSARGGAYYLPYIMSVYRKYSNGSWSEKFIKGGDLLLRATTKAIEDSYRLERLVDFKGKSKIFRELRLSYIFQIASTMNIDRSIRIKIIKNNFDFKNFLGLSAAIGVVILNKKLPQKIYNASRYFRKKILKYFQQNRIFE